MRKTHRIIGGSWNLVIEKDDKNGDAEDGNGIDVHKSVKNAIWATVRRLEYFKIYLSHSSDSFKKMAASFASCPLVMGTRSVAAIVVEESSSVSSFLKQDYFTYSRKM